MKGRPLLVLLVLASGLFSPCVFSEDQIEAARDYRYGSVRLGAFWIGQINSSIAARSESFPIGIFIDLSKDLGLGDSVTVPRGLFTYRFSRRHQVNFDVFRINRDSQRILERPIEIGKSEFPAGTLVNTFGDAQVYKAVYTWLFYDRGRVTLGASVGLNVVDFSVGLDVVLSEKSMGENVIKRTAGTTAPLPVLGFRVAFRATPKLSLVAAADVLLFEAGSYHGTFQDTYVLLDWRFSEHFSFGGGLNSVNLELELEDEVLVSMRHNYRGVLAFAGVHF